jgi:hypothetical protein
MKLTTEESFEVFLIIFFACSLAALYLIGAEW